MLNDVVVKSGRSIWFTDPSYRILMDYEGARAQSEIGACHAYRIDPDSGEFPCVARDYVKPSGLAFSPDESALLIAETGVTHAPDGPAHIRKHKVHPIGTLSGGAVFAECTSGVFDGFQSDQDGRI